MKDTLDRAQLFALLRKQRREASASFRKGNFNAVGFLFRLALVAVFLAVFILFLGNFLEIYLAVKTDGAPDASSRLFEVLTAAYTVVLLAMVVGAVSQINRALFLADDMRVMSALPVGAKTLYVSKLIVIYLHQAVTAAVCVLSVNLTCAAYLPQGWLYYLLTVLAVFLLPLLSVGIASVLALPFHALRLLLRDRFVLSFLVITLVTAGLLFLYAYLLEGVKELLLGDDIKYFFNEGVMNAIGTAVSYMYPANLLAGLFAGKNVLYCCLVLLAVLAACALVSLVGIRFILVRALRARTGSQHVYTRSRFYLHGEKPQLLALMKKEFLLIFRTPDYMFSYFSVALVVPLMVYFCMSVGASLVVRLIAVQCDVELAVFLTLVFGSLANVFCTTNISRDGSMFYSVKAMPVGYRSVIFSKVFLCLIVTALSQLLTAAVLLAAGYLSALNALFLFGVGLLFGVAQICIATRVDLNHAKFSMEPDGEIKESGNTASVVIVAGLLTSFLVGGAVLLARMFLALRGLADRYAYLTFLVAGGVALLFALLGVFVLLYKLKSRYYRFSGGVL